MKKFWLISSISILLALLLPASASAGWVNGYWKSNGTYVNGYWKSNPNGLKYDNYSFDGNWADAFNNSYYSPTKNYSSSWYTPSWFTQSDYWVGKSFYDSRNSYSSFTPSTSTYTYSFWDDPIYTYKPSYNYGYNALDLYSSSRSLGSYTRSNSLFNNSYSNGYNSSYGSYNLYSPTNRYNSLFGDSYYDNDYSGSLYSSPSLYSAPSYSIPTTCYSIYCY